MPGPNRSVQLDVFPEKLVVVPNAAASTENGALQVLQVQNPAAALSSLAVASNRAVVMEVLEVDVITDSNGPPAGFTTGEAKSAYWICDTTKWRAGGGTDLSAAELKNLIESPTQFSFIKQDSFLLTSGAAVCMESTDLVDKIEDQQGTGVLVAAPYFYVYQVRTNSGGTDSFTAMNWRMDIYYRLVDVPLSEYLGIIQSQTRAQIAT